VAVEKPRDDEEDPAGRLRCGGRDRRCRRAHHRRLGLLAERDADLLVLRRYATLQINNIMRSVVVFAKPARSRPDATLQTT